MPLEIENLCNNNFDFNFCATMYNNMTVALRAYELFKHDNREYFSYNKTETLFGHLRTYVIEKQIYNSAFHPNASYTVMNKEVNKYKYKALCIETNQFILNIGRTDKSMRLLPGSKYRKNFAQANNGFETQLVMQLTDDSIQICEDKKYAELIYGYGKEGLRHLEILIPSHDYSCILHSMNLLGNAKLYSNYVPTELVEESIVQLKKTLEEKVSK